MTKLPVCDCFVDRQTSATIEEQPHPFYIAPRSKLLLVLFQMMSGMSGMGGQARSKGSRKERASDEF